MSQKEEEKKGKRTLKNNPLNKNPENFKNTNENLKTEDRLNHQDNQAEDNKNIQAEVYNIKHQVNIESSAAVSSRDQMLASPIQNQAQQIPINTGNNINQIRTDPIQNPQIVRNQVASPDNERVHYKITFLPSVIIVKTYKPFCAKNVNNPSLYFY